MDEEIKSYDLSKEEQSELKRITSTMGFLNTLYQGLETFMQIFKVRVEQRLSIGQAPEGWSYQTRIDPVDMKLQLKKEKLPEKEDKK